MRRRTIVAFAVFATYLVVSTAPVAATHGGLVVGSEHSTDTDFNNAQTLDRVSVSGSGTAADVALDPPVEYAVVDDSGDGTAESDRTFVGGNDNTAFHSEFKVQPTTDLTLHEITAQIVETRGTDYGFTVDIYAVQENPDGTVGEGTLIKSNWDPEFTTGPQSIRTDSTVNMTAGDSWTLEFVVSSPAPSGSSGQIRIGMDGDSGLTSWYWNPVAGFVDAGGELTLQDASPDNGTYISPNHTVSNAQEAWANITVSNATASVEWQAWNSSTEQWQVVNASTFSTTGNHSLDISGTDYETWRVNVSFKKTGANPTAQLNDEGVLVETGEPTVDDASLSPNTTSTSQDLPVTLSADVSDPDFGTSYGDSATVYWHVDGEERGTTTVSSNGTTSIQLSDVGAGEHDWHIEVEDEFGHRTTSATGQFAMPAELRIYNESAPTELVDNATVELRMLTNETGAVEVYERTASNGVINMTGLPTEKPFIVVADADGYYDRRIFVRSLYETQSIYMLPDSEQVADTIFSIDDYTGKFASEDTVLLVQRPLNGSYRTVLGDYFGSTGEFPAELAYNTRHRLVLYNVQTGEQRIAGTYTPLTSSTQTVVVTPEGVTNIEGEAPNARLQPQVRRLPALDGADLSVTLREGNLTVTDWTVTATLENNSSSTTVWTASGTGPGTLSQTLDLDDSYESTLVVTVTWNTSEGLSASETFRISLTEAIGNDHSLLDGVTSLAALSPEGGARAAFTGFLAMLITVLVIAGVGSIQPSGEIAGLAGILTLTGFAVIGFGVTYDVVFVASVGWISFAAIRRGF